MAVRPATCPACGGHTFADRPVTAELVEHSCAGCGLLASSVRRSGPVVSEFALVDERAYLDSVGEARRRQARTLLRLLERLPVTGRRLLDIGCSFGFFLAEARAAGWQVTGIEPDAQARAHARALLGAGAVRGGLLGPDTAAPGSADVLATLDVIEHLPPADQAAFADRVRATLVPGGVWLIKVPSTEGLYYRGAKAAARVAPRLGATLLERLWQTAYEYPHTVYFDRATLTRWLDRHGFDVLAVRYLPEVPPGTATDRLATDGRISRRQARLLALALYAVTAVDWLRRRSDALAVAARPRRGFHPAPDPADTEP